jgi:peptidoglycan-N-acetylmuramic acid deacetylase
MSRTLLRNTVCAVLLLALAGTVLLLRREPSLPASTAAVIPVSGSNWGLSFPVEGQSPVGNATREELAQYDAWFLGNTDEQVIYLTFDCGYENGYTEPILDALKKHNAPAAFFVVGNMIESAPDIIRRMAEEGHIVGNHTFHHPDMSAISDQAAFRRELEDLETLYRDTVGEEMPRYYRPPQGKYSEVNLRHADELGYTTFFWSLAYVDWYEDKQPERTEAMNLLNSRIHPGAIVLLHSTSKTNADILAELIRKWKRDGYVFRSLEELTEKEPGMEDAGLF